MSNISGSNWFQQNRINEDLDLFFQSSLDQSIDTSIFSDFDVSTSWSFSLFAEIYTGAAGNYYPCLIVNTGAAANDQGSELSLYGGTKPYFRITDGGATQDNIYATKETLKEKWIRIRNKIKYPVLFVIAIIPLLIMIQQYY